MPTLARIRDNRKATAVLLAVALVAGALGTVRAQEPTATDMLTTGHTTFLNAGTTFDDCFAGIAGALMTRVVWFNGATLFNRMAGGSDTWVYAVETLGGPGHDVDPADGRDDHTDVKPFNPSQERLFETGNVWTFPDENDPTHEWTVHEYYFLTSLSNSNLPSASTDDGVKVDGGDAEVNQKKVYVYAVKVSPNALTDKTLLRDYNFVLVVNTCQFLHNSGGTVNHTDGNNANPRLPEGQHDPNDVPPGACEDAGEECTHEHRTFTVDIFVGGKPKSVPVPTDPDQAETGEPGGGAP